MWLLFVFRLFTFAPAGGSLGAAVPQPLQAPTLGAPGAEGVRAPRVPGALMAGAGLPVPGGIPHPQGLPVDPVWSLLRQGRVEAIDSEGGAFVWRSPGRTLVTARQGDFLESTFLVLAIRGDRVLLRAAARSLAARTPPELAWLDLAVGPSAPSTVRPITRSSGEFALDATPLGLATGAEAAPTRGPPLSGTPPQP